ncbi:MAG: NAD(P)/FAD-dependent oxidoreductase [Pseudomonadales bacterium]|nr:NAD(P)/FAD-dependent oxidoreductase [Pseudomonadales bacterium]
MDHVDICVIGAGVVGLAIGRALSGNGREVVVLDRAARYGEGVSSRNSEVIHAGIYYDKDSLKAVTCVRGKELLYDYCRRRGVGHRRCGKLIVATTPEEESVLEDIDARARANGVDDLTVWSREKIEKAEPAVRATLGLLSPSTGIVSAHELMNAYLGDMEANGGTFAGLTRVIEIQPNEGNFVLVCDMDGSQYRFSCRLLINSAGLGAQQIAGAIAGLDQSSVPPLYLCKGNYFPMGGKSPFSHLIYPVPEKSGAGLGVHATIDLGGQVKFGPDVEYIGSEDYSVSTERLDAYYTAVRRYFPGLPDDALTPGYAGIRPKLQGPADRPRDFEIHDHHVHGIQGLIQLFGIESPGLTSSLAIADHVKGLLADQLAG